MPWRQPWRSRAGRLWGHTATSRVEWDRTPTSSDRSPRVPTRGVSCSNWSRTRRMRCADGSGRCEVILTSDSLYVANSGEPFTVNGVVALMGTHDSVKRDDQIGRFGLGFKSLLAVTDSPRVFSRSGSFVFDKVESERELAAIVPGLPALPGHALAARRGRPDRREPRRPVLSGPHEVGHHRDRRARSPRTATSLRESLKKFPAEFLLFSQQVERLGLEDRGRPVTARSITLAKDDDGCARARRRESAVASGWCVPSGTSPSKAALRTAATPRRERV